jgi:glycosyltransferase involved in cell wall biosynthesis
VSKQPGGGRVDLSVVVPTYNEQENVLPLVKRLSAVLEQLTKSYEIIFVDDGSRDKTFELLSKAHDSDKHIKLIKFRRNFGQTAALSAGFSHATGKIIITTDADLQNFPEDIPLLLSKMKEGYDVVSGWRHNRRDPLFSKRIPSLISNWLSRKLFGLNIHDSGCTLKAYKREIIEDLMIYGEMHRFIPAILSAKGFRVGEVKVRHEQRTAGKSKYRFTRLPMGLLDLFYVSFWSAYSTKPLHLFGMLGLLQYVLSALLFLEQMVKAIINMQLIAGPIFILAVLLAITGTQFVIFGFLGEILIRTYYSNVKHTSYSIEKILE